MHSFFSRDHPVPGAHAIQPSPSVAAPLLMPDFPAGHLVQVAAPGCAEKEPRWHRSQYSAPGFLPTVPGLHWRQEAKLLPAVPGFARPDGHALHDVDPATSAKVPVWHGSQKVAALFSCEYPWGQEAQMAPLSLCSVKDPG